VGKRGRPALSAAYSRLGLQLPKGDDLIGLLAWGIKVPESDADKASRTGVMVYRFVLVFLLLRTLGLTGPDDISITAYYWTHQDRLLVVGLFFVLLALSFHAPHWSIPDIEPRRWVFPALLLALVLTLWWGTYALMSNYALTRDEHMVLFDMAVFAKGRLLEPIGEAWRSNPKAVVPDFLLDVPGSVALVSGYLPGNAMLRLAFSKVADPGLMNPLLVAVGGVALFDLARRQFGADRRAILVAMVLYFGSAQLLVNAMTVYAMTGHTALNLVWLALFMRGGKWGHAGAMAVGFVAMGMHQVVFHPLFVAPFLLWLLFQRRYRPVAAYAGFYAAAGIFWIAYPSLAIQSAGIVASGGASNAMSFWQDRVWPLLVHREPMTFIWMSLNLFRFFVWNHLALIPLLAATWPLIRRNEGIAAPLAGGIALTVLFCGFILPMQGHGWGYRYVAACLGSFALLGALGYRYWASRAREAADGTVMLLSVLTLGFMAVSIWGAGRFVTPHAELDRMIAASKAQIALIDTEWPGHAIDNVRNLPDLSNRPLRLSSRALDGAAIARLCARGKIALITRREFHEVGLARDFSERSPRFEAKVAQALAGKPCQVSPR